MPTTSKEIDAELAEARKGVGNLLAGQDPKGRTKRKSLSLALGIASRIHQRCLLSRAMREGVERACESAKIKNSKKANDRTRLVKLLFPRQSHTTTNRYAGVLLTAERDRLEPHKLVARLHKRTLAAVATKYQGPRPAGEDRKFSWKEAKPVLERIRKFPCDLSLKGHHIAVVWFNEGKCTVSLLKGAPRARDVVRRAMKTARSKQS